MAKQPTDAGEAANRKDGTAGILRDRYIVDTSRPLPDMNTAYALAYEVKDRKDPDRKLFGLVGQTMMPPRADAMASMRTVTNPGLLTVMEWGTIDWPPLGRRALAVVLDRPVGGRLMADMEERIRPIDEHFLIKRFLPSVLGGLQELYSRGVVHRAIRPDNIFYYDAERTRIVLGECYSTPSGATQPLAFETIPCGLCHPVGRGSGEPDNDFYALGVTILCLFLGYNPVARMSDEKLMETKLLYGSFGALVGDLRLPMSMLELLRGLLSDDPATRWGAEDLEMWMSGRRLTPLQQKPEKRPARGLLFRDCEYFSTRTLAEGLSRNWEAAASMLKEGQIEVWLRRSLDDADRATAVGNAIRTCLNAIGDQRVAEDAMITRVCALLDPTGPIRYHGLSFMPQALPTVFAHYAIEKGDAKPIIELVLRDIPRIWAEHQTGVRLEGLGLDKTIKILKSHLQTTAKGHGVERCLYDLNPNLACLSPLVANQYVDDLKRLLPALEAAARQTEHKGMPLDRHIAAFIAARWSGDVDAQLILLNDDRPDRSILGGVSLLAMLQWKLGPDTVLNLAGWVGGQLQPVISSFHSRSLRSRIEKEVPRIIRKGNLTELYNILDNTEERRRDADGYAAAIREYAAAELEVASLDAEAIRRNDAAEATAHQTAAMLAIGCAILTVIILGMLRMV